MSIIGKIKSVSFQNITCIIAVKLNHSVKGPWFSAITNIMICSTITILEL